MTDTATSQTAAYCRAQAAVKIPKHTLKKQVLRHLERVNPAGREVPDASKCTTEGIAAALGRPWHHLTSTINALQKSGDIKQIGCTTSTDETRQVTVYQITLPGLATIMGTDSAGGMTAAEIEADRLNAQFADLERRERRHRAAGEALKSERRNLETKADEHPDQTLLPFHKNGGEK
ncbi:MAG: hypothetical protein MJH10_11315 [Epibacterium sp.]|nr:hypothetical protein [Epibacterium sp.]NQX74136.1 hypothetical protein [Epibacterium sp.]